MKIKVMAVVILVTLVIPVDVGHRFFDDAEAGPAAQQPAGGLPTFQVDRSWLRLPGKWKLGDVSSVAIDMQDHVWILHRPRTLPADQMATSAPPVLEFDSAGNFIQGWGGAGNGYEWPEREHGLYVDYKDNVWIGGNNCPGSKLPGLKPVADDQLVKFTKAGKFVMQVGQSNKSSGNTDTRNLHRPADVSVYRKTNEVFVADGYGNHRLIVFDADSGLSNACGAPLATNRLTTTTVPRHRFLPSRKNVARPAAIRHRARRSRFQRWTRVFADREHRRVQVFNIDGKFLSRFSSEHEPERRGLRK